MIDQELNTGDPVGKVSLLAFVMGWSVTKMVEFGGVISVLLDIVLVCVGLISIVNGIIKIFEKLEEWKKKRNSGKNSVQPGTKSY